MLAIEREPMYKNKLLLSTLAVALGFIMTVAIIRAVNPADSTRQSAQTNSDKRSRSLIPITASESESASERDSGDTNSAADSSWSAAGSAISSPSSQRAANSQSTSWTTASSSNNGSTSPTTPPAQPAPAEPTPADTGTTGTGGGTTTENPDGGILPCIELLPLVTC